MENEIFNTLDSAPENGYQDRKHPLVHLFPGGSGDSAIFSVDNYNVLVNGSSLLKPTFWRVIRTYSRLDCMIATHLSKDTLTGFKSLFKRKLEEGNVQLPWDENSGDYQKMSKHLISPEMGVLLMNLPKNAIAAAKELKDGEDDDVIRQTIQLIQKLNIDVRPLASKEASIVPMTVYSRAGVGQLDVYPLLPEYGSKELQYLYEEYGTKPDLSDKDAVMSRVASVCCLLVWKPDKPDEKIVRLLFPGNQKQDKILKAFEKLKDADFLHAPSPTRNSLKMMKEAAAAAACTKTSVRKFPLKTTTSRPLSSSRASATSNRPTSARTTTIANKPSTTSRPASARPPNKASTTLRNTSTAKQPTQTKKPTASTTRPASARPASARPTSAKTTQKVSTTTNRTGTNSQASSAVTKTASKVASATTKTSTTTVKSVPASKRPVSNRVPPAKTNKTVAAPNPKKSLPADKKPITNTTNKSARAKSATTKPSATLATKKQTAVGKTTVGKSPGKKSSPATTTNKTSANKTSVAKGDKVPDKRPSPVGEEKNKVLGDVVVAETDNSVVKKKDDVTLSDNVDVVKSPNKEVNGLDDAEKVNSEEQVDEKPTVDNLKKPVEDVVVHKDTSSTVIVNKNEDEAVVAEAVVAESAPVIVDTKQLEDEIENKIENLAEASNAEVKSEVVLQPVPLEAGDNSTNEDKLIVPLEAGDNSTNEDKLTKSPDNMVVTPTAPAVEQIGDHLVEDVKVASPVKDEQQLIDAFSQDTAGNSSNLIIDEPMVDQGVTSDLMASASSSQLLLHLNPEAKPYSPLSPASTPTDAIKETSPVASTHSSPMQQQFDVTSPMSVDTPRSEHGVDELAISLQEQEDNKACENEISVTSSVSSHEHDGTSQSHQAQIDSPHTTEYECDSPYNTSMMTSASSANINTEAQHLTGSATDDKHTALHTAAPSTGNSVQVDDNGNEMMTSSNIQNVAGEGMMNPTTELQDFMGNSQQSNYCDVTPIVAPLAGADESDHEVIQVKSPLSTIEGSVSINEPQEPLGGKQEQTPDDGDSGSYLLDFTPQSANFVLEDNKMDPQMPVATTLKKDTKKKRSDSAKLQTSYVDVTYIPCHDVTSTFFKQIRSRYYVSRGDDVSASTLNELLEGVKSWKNKPNVTIIPAQDSATLKQWVNEKHEELVEANVQVVECGQFKLNGETVEACSVDLC